jgi:hypothetical protein
MYMQITLQDGASSSKKKDKEKDLAFKASQEKRSKPHIVLECASDDDSDDESLTLMVKKTTKMLKKLNKNDIKFDGKKKKFFTSIKRKPISEIDCYNCGEFSHLAHKCPKAKKDKHKKRNKGKKDNTSDDEDDKKKNKPCKKKDGKNKEYHKKKGGKGYIVGDWLTDIESSSCSSGDENDDEKEKVAALVIGSTTISINISTAISTIILYTPMPHDQG